MASGNSPDCRWAFILPTSATSCAIVRGAIPGIAQHPAAKKIAKNRKREKSVPAHGQLEKTFIFVFHWQAPIAQHRTADARSSSF
jgi:hypothetical protein